MIAPGSANVPISRKERFLFLLLASVVLVYVALRAALVPFVHDESASVMWYAERGEFLPYLAHWDANNHVLSSAFGAFLIGALGLPLLAVRTGSVLAFVLYAWAVHRIGARVQDLVLRWCLWAALLLCPFLLDFFSLFRGYGAEMAFLMVAVEGGMAYAEQRRLRDLGLLLGGMLLADLAVLALVPLWAAVVGATGLGLFLRQRAHALPRPMQAWSVWVLLGALPCAIAVVVAFTMRSLGLLYHGSTEGFLEVTVAPLFGLVLGVQHNLLYLLTGALLIASTVLLLRAKHKAGSVVAALFWGDVLLRVVMALLLGVNYPEDRAALHLLPLAILLLVFAVDVVQRERPVLKWSALLLLALPLRMVATVNFDHTLLWPEQSVPTRFLERIVDMQRAQDRPLVIGAYHQLNLCLALNARTHGLSLNAPEVDGFPEGPHDVRIVDHRFLQDALVGFHSVDHDPGPGLDLLVRDTPLSWSLVFEHMLPDPAPDAEFVEVFAADSTYVNDDLLVEVHATMYDTDDRLNAYLVTSTKLAEVDMRYDAVPLGLYRTLTTGGEVHLARLLPGNTGADRRVAYFWNVRPPGTRFTDITVRVYRRAQ